MKRLSFIENFWSKVEMIPFHSCWEWTGCKDKDGYGIIGRRISGKKATYKAHRFSYEYHVGSIPINKIIMHTCDNPSCVNPRHLKIGTPLDNNLDKIRKNRDRSPSGKNHWTYKKHQFRNSNGQFKKAV